MKDIKDALHPRNFSFKKTGHLLHDFLEFEASGGILLIIASLLAILIANSPLAYHYNYFFDVIDFRIGFSDAGDYNLEIKKPLLLWVNDGLMAIFFFLVGLEIKREVTEGKLASVQGIMLPAFAAIGGMVVPALIYWFINKDSPETLSGWAIPAATDIAFALGVLSLLASRVPVQLKVLLTAIAIIDDLGAIIIIALFYSDQIVTEALVFSGLMVALLYWMNRANVTKVTPYVLIGALLWAAVLKSGVHATLAGVLVALFIPLHDKKNKDVSPAKDLEHALHPWVAYLILPVFGFANAGISFHGMDLSILTDPITLGIASGLLIGKPVGIFGMVFLAVMLGFARKPDDVRWRHIFGLSILCGIGFTMSLFIGGLAFKGHDAQVAIRLGVLIGSILSATLGYILLRTTCKSPSVTEHIVANNRNPRL
ncbi:MAG: Na+/H+ antiporter NhaA [Pseudobdellovibrionaceae bacterium]